MLVVESGVVDAGRNRDEGDWTIRMGKSGLMQGQHLILGR